MKATKVVPPPDPQETQPCATCGKPLTLPWGRVNHGKEWTCSKTCDMAYYSKGVRNGTEDLPEM